MKRVENVPQIDLASKSKRVGKAGARFFTPLWRWMGAEDLKDLVGFARATEHR